MRIQCDSCEKKLASVMCCADEVVLCSDCDTRLHVASKLASKHQRVGFLSVQESPICDICQEKLAFFFCLEDRAILCRKCDMSIHEANTVCCKHQRFLIPGICMSLDAILVEESITRPSSPEDFTSSVVQPRSACVLNSSTLKSADRLAIETKVPVATSRVSSLATPSSSTNLINPRRLQGGGSVPNLTSIPSFSSGHQSSSLVQKSSIAEFLMPDVTPGWQVEELLYLPDMADVHYTSDSVKAEASDFGEYNWISDFGLYENQVAADAIHEVPKLPFPPSPPVQQQVTEVIMPHISKASSRKSLKGKVNQEAIVLAPAEFQDAFVVPNLGIQKSPKQRKRNL